MLIDIARNIDQHFIGSKVNFLKDDHSTSVIKIEVDGKNFIARRDNPGSWLRFTRRLFKKSRSMKTWNKAHWLNKNELKTIIPCAVVEDYIFFIRASSFIITECIDGDTFKSYLADPAVSTDSKFQMSSRVISLINHWHSIGINHGDPKGPNIIVDNDDVILIDIEDATASRTKLRKRRAFAKDWAIVLHNLQRYEELRKNAQNQILTIFDGDPDYFSKLLVKKSLIQEHSLVSQSFNEVFPANEIDAVISGSNLPDNWSEVTKTGEFIHLSHDNNDIHLISSSEGFIKAPSNVKGVFSLALALRVCGIDQTRILDGGYKGDKEYLIYSTAQTETVETVLKRLVENSDQQVELITRLGEVLGRLHLRGFIHGNLCLSDICVSSAEDGNAPLIFVTRNTKWYGKRIKDKISADLSDIHQQLSSRSNCHLLTPFKEAYNQTFYAD
ncbi:hypothetical protein DV711_14115 [Motiliproteus coralliicola]|uniref:Protein kinase domain-containing protein n=2 Tax=Motiliproteus coralliicola TaxID=2283196 RepID=A0A369WBR7_9GAMM|nr:hypothetical protein DV711_14115 [Motiliproteus coralliicola]